MGSRPCIWKTAWQMWEALKMSSGDGQLEEEQRKTPMCYSQRKYRVGGRGGGKKWPPRFCKKVLINHPSG